MYKAFFNIDLGGLTLENAIPHRLALVFKRSMRHYLVQKLVEGRNAVEGLLMLSHFERPTWPTNSV